MNWLIIILNITFASIAILLCVLGLSTLKTIRHLNMGKSFWIPVFVSGLLFSIGSITTIFNEVGLPLTSTDEIGQITQLIALCFLSGGIYGYSRRIRKNLLEKYTIPEAISTQNGKMEAHVAPTRSVDKRTMTSNDLRIETASRCSHQFGYLRTLPINAPLPEECLSCDKLIKCKHS
jgi:hypothetical protein